MGRKRILFLAAVMLLVLTPIFPAGAAYYNGQDIDGVVFDGAIYLLDPKENL